MLDKNIDKINKKQKGQNTKIKNMYLVREDTSNGDNSRIKSKMIK